MPWSSISLLHLQRSFVQWNSKLMELRFHVISPSYFIIKVNSAFNLILIFSKFSLQLVKPVLPLEFNFPVVITRLSVAVNKITIQSKLSLMSLLGISCLYRYIESSFHLPCRQKNMLFWIFWEFLRSIYCILLSQPI